jgi:hypothetical protein
MAMIIAVVLALPWAFRRPPPEPPRDAAVMAGTQLGLAYPNSGWEFC